MEVRTGGKWTAFAFPKLPNRQRFGEEADKQQLKRLATGLFFNGRYGRRIERRNEKVEDLFCPKISVDNAIDAAGLTLGE